MTEASTNSQQRPQQEQQQQQQQWNNNTSDGSQDPTTAQPSIVNVGSNGSPIPRQLPHQSQSQSQETQQSQQEQEQEEQKQQQQQHGLQFLHSYNSSSAASDNTKDFHAPGGTTAASVAAASGIVPTMTSTPAAPTITTTPPQPAPPRLILANSVPEDTTPHHTHYFSPTSSSYLPYNSSAAGYTSHPTSHPHHKPHSSHHHHHHPDLHLQTNLIMTSSAVSSSNNPKSIPVPAGTRPSAAALSRSNSFQSSLSPNSAAGSPSLGGFLSEITPLPSPVVTADSPGPWRLFRNGSISSRPTSRGSIASLSINEQTDYIGGDPVPAGVGRSPSKRKLYQGLNHIDAPTHEYGRIHSGSSRSVSEHQGNNGNNNVYKLDVPIISRQTQTEEASGKTGSTDANESSSTTVHPFKREEHLAGRHGHQRKTGSTADLQSTQPSIPSTDGGADTNSTSETDQDGGTREIFTATTVPGNNIRRWRAVRLLGQGTFSKVILGTLELKKTTTSESDLDRNKLVAVKIVENTAAGGASKARIESSLKRELDILKTIKHPSLVHLKAQSIERKRALIVLSYCAGGDLFDLATNQPKLLTPKFVRRIFAELVGAVRYLHISGIVHRDIKLENVLINFTPEELEQSTDEIINSNRSITTLTDLGLSRRIDFDEPLLTTRCGSEDYAAPELLLGQPYDGRQTDAWALGVLLYAICESRLPFDPSPGATEHKMRTRTAHRIARCDWKWYKLAGTPTPPPVQEEGVEVPAEPVYDPEWNPAKEVVDGLLRRVKKRVPLEEVEKTDWVQGAIAEPLELPPSTEELEEVMEEDEDIEAPGEPNI